MPKIIVLAAVLALLLVAPAQVAGAHPTNIEHGSARGTDASAYFASTSGCIFQDVHVLAVQSLGGGRGGAGGNRIGAAVSVYRTDRCTGELLFFGSTGGYDFPVAFTWQARLESAELHATVPIHDHVSGATVPVRVDIAWTGTGELLRDQSHFRYEDEGDLFSTHQNGALRYATATGTVTDGITDFILPGTAGVGWISWANYGQIVYNLPER